MSERENALTSRQLLIGHSAELAKALRAEITALAHDAESFRRQDRPMLAANVLTLRRRLVDLLKLARTVAEEGKP